MGNFVGPFIFLAEERPHFGTGFAITCVTAAISGALAIAYRLVSERDNRERDRSGCHEGFDHAFEDPTDKTVSELSVSTYARLNADYETEQTVSVHYMMNARSIRISLLSSATASCQHD